MTVNSQLEVACAHLHEDGRGCADSDGLEVRVPRLLPGERATVVLEHQSPHQRVAWARIEERVGPLSSERTEPACPVHGDCGGCAWQHLALAGQLREKRSRLVRAFAAAGLRCEVAEPVPAPSPLGYRNKGKYVVARVDGAVVLGAYRPDSSDVISTLGCRIVEPVIDAAARRIAAIAPASGASLRYVVIRSGSDGRVVIGLVTRALAVPPELARVASELVGEPSIAGVVWFGNDRTDGALLAGTKVRLAGVDTVVEELDAGVALRFDIPLTAFWQVNRAQAARVYERIAEIVAESVDLGAGAEVLDAYAGVGAIGLVLASRASDARLVSVERDPSAVAVARATAARAGLTVGARCLDATDVLESDCATPTVIVNPPRKGLHQRGRDALARGACRQLIYLSCGPESLVRDLAVLSGAGFEIARVEPFDMMPGTGQIETLVQLLR